jgi:hypothetical protein
VTCRTRRWTNEEGNEQRLGVLHVEVEEAHHGAADVDATGELRDLAEVVVAVRRRHELALAARLKRKGIKGADQSVGFIDKRRAEGGGQRWSCAWPGERGDARTMGAAGWTYFSVVVSFLALT